MLPLRSLAVAAAAAASVALAVPAMASSNQGTVDLAGQVIDLGPVTCLPGSPDLLVTVGHGHDHTVSNNNGDWENATIVGTGNTTDGVWVGGVTAWFGFEGNNQTTVFHSTANGQLYDAAGDKVTVHTEGQGVMNANGTVTVNRNPNEIISDCH